MLALIRFRAIQAVAHAAAISVMIPVCTALLLGGLYLAALHGDKPMALIFGAVFSTASFGGIAILNTMRRDIGRWPAPRPDRVHPLPKLT